MSAGVLPLQGKIQHYAWGGFNYLAQLLGQNFGNEQACAEYWLGSHPTAPAQVVLAGHTQTLGEYLEQQQLPSLQFLFKVLDVRDMLSIQVHPNRQQAQQGFANEEAQGIPLSAKYRNYKDQNHKPELMVALSDFWLLHGFADSTKVVQQLEQKPYLADLLTLFKSEGLNASFARVLDNHHPFTQALQQAVIEDYSQDQQDYPKSEIHYWLKKWVIAHPDIPNGLLTLFFLNLVELKKGQGIFQPNGLLHAYLEGQNIELMANSDNVLRAGLTPKHMDVAELLKICKIEPSNSSDFIIESLQNNSETHYPTPFEEFSLSSLALAAGEEAELINQTLEICFCLEGRFDIKDLNNPSQSWTLLRGQSLLLHPHQNLQLVASAAPNNLLFRASN